MQELRARLNDVRTDLSWEIQQLKQTVAQQQEIINALKTGKTCLMIPFTYLTISDLLIPKFGPDPQAIHAHYFNVSDAGPGRRFVLGGETPIAFTAAINPVRVSSVDKHEVLQFDNVITDIGAGYNNQTGIFVVPESGVYMFSCSLLDDSVHIMVHADIMHNTRVLGRVFAVGEPNGHRDQGSNTVFTYAAAGDQVVHDVYSLGH